jgi:hypothetical protein
MASDAPPPPPPPPPPPDRDPSDLAPEAPSELANAMADGDDPDARRAEPDAPRQVPDGHMPRPEPETPDTPRPDLTSDLRSALAEPDAHQPGPPDGHRVEPGQAEAAQDADLAQGGDGKDVIVPDAEIGTPSSEKPEPLGLEPPGLEPTPEFQAFLDDFKAQKEARGDTSGADAAEPVSEQDADPTEPAADEPVESPPVSPVTSQEPLAEPAARDLSDDGVLGTQRDPTAEMPAHGRSTTLLENGGPLLSGTDNADGDTDVLVGPGGLEAHGESVDQNMLRSPDRTLDLPRTGVSPELRSAMTETHDDPSSGEGVEPPVDGQEAEPSEGSQDGFIPTVTNASDEDSSIAGTSDADVVTDEGPGPSDDDNGSDADHTSSESDDPSGLNDPDWPDPDSITMTPERTKHILDGDARGGGHRAGTGKPGYTEFPADWDDDKICENVEEVARNPESRENKSQPAGRWLYKGTRDDVQISVIVEAEGGICTAWPREGDPGVIKNPGERF